LAWNNACCEEFDDHSVQAAAGHDRHRPAGSPCSQCPGRQRHLQCCCHQLLHEQQDIDRRSQWVGAWESHNQVTDNISITPAIFYASDYRNNGFDSTWGGVIQTTFRF